MKKLRNINDMRDEFAAVKRGCGSDTVFMAKAMMWMCEQVYARQHDKTCAYMLKVVVRELRELRREMAAKRTVEVTLADRIRILEDASNLKDLASQLAEKARELEAVSSENTGKATGG